MKVVKRTITTTASSEAAFAYLADFANAVECDSGTVSCVRVSGDGGPGTTYRNVSKFAGREIELIYTVERVEPPRLFAIVGGNRTVTSDDTIVVRPKDSGSDVTYTAKFTFAGVGRLLEPVMTPLLAKLGNDTARTLQKALDRL